MISALLNGVIGFVGSIVGSLLTPITNSILNLFPNVATPLSYVSGFLNYLKQFVPFAFSYLGFTSEVKATIISLFGLTITIPLSVHIIKLVIRWYNALKI